MGSYADGTDAAQPTPEQPFVSLLPARPAAAKKVPRSVKMLSIGNLQDVDAKLLEPRVSVRCLHSA